MSTSTADLHTARAEHVAITGDTLSVDLTDGRTVSVPLAWFPRLVHGTSSERAQWRLIGRGEGIHWSELDEDIGVENLLRGQPSGESQSSLQRWLNHRASGSTSGKRGRRTGGSSEAMSPSKKRRAR
jgi:hypothetical protein